EGLHVFWETASAIANAGKQTTRADMRISTDAASDGVHISAHSLTDVGNFIHKGNFGSQHCISSVFCELLAASIHHNDRLSGAIKRLIKSRHYFIRPFGSGPDNYALGVHKVIHSGSFVERLGVGNYIELILTKMFGHRSMDTVSSTDRHGRFIDNHGIII